MTLTKTEHKQNMRINMKLNKQKQCTTGTKLA